MHHNNTTHVYMHQRSKQRGKGNQTNPNQRPSKGKNNRIITHFKYLINILKILSKIKNPIETLTLNSHEIADRGVKSE